MTFWSRHSTEVRVDLDKTDKYNEVTPIQAGSEATTASGAGKKTLEQRQEEAREAAEFLKEDPNWARWGFRLDFDISSFNELGAMLFHFRRQLPDPKG